TPADADEARALARDLDGLALALEQAGAFVCKHRCSLADYRQRWRDQEQRVLEWFGERAMKYPRSVAVTWQTTIEQLSAGGRALLNVLAWLAPDPIPRAMIVTNEGMTGPDGASIDAEAALADLASYSLARWDEAGTAFTVHR